MFGVPTVPRASKVGIVLVPHIGRALRGADVPRCNLLAAARRLFTEVVKLASAREELPDWAVVPLWCALLPASPALPRSRGCLPACWRAAMSRSS